jgi:predicted DNA-binding antitoxin AbrB/MazE fold protein
MIEGDFRRFGMGITVEAIYESGVLKPLKPLDALQEHERVRITVQPVGVVAEQRRDRIKLDQAVAHEIAESPEYDLLAD